MTVTEEVMRARRAIESLRSGVPNSAAVDVLGMDEPEIEEAFEQRLEALNRHDGAPIPGFFVEGDFGTGKSHILRYLENAAIKRKLATSSVIVSKETPLGDLPLVFRSAILSLANPDGRNAGSLAEVFESLDTDSTEYVAFYRAVCDEVAGLDPLFRASILLYDRHRGDPAVIEQLVEFWDGGPPQVSTWKKLLREVDAAPKLKAVNLRDLAIQRFRFVSLALRAARISGWLITIDEIELIAKLTLPARTKAYAVIDQLFNFHRDGSRTPAASVAVTDAIVIGAITTDLVGELLHTRNERAFLPRQVRLTEDMARAALSGLDSLESTRWRHMISPDLDLGRVWETLKLLYVKAYPDDIENPDILGEYDPSAARRIMRHNIRTWVWSWDLKRLDPNYRSTIVTEKISIDLSEDKDVDLPEDETSFEPAV